MFQTFKPNYKRVPQFVQTQQINETFRIYLIVIKSIWDYKCNLCNYKLFNENSTLVNNVNVVQFHFLQIAVSNFAQNY